MKCPKCSKAIGFFEVKREFECPHCRASLMFPEGTRYMVFILLGSALFLLVFVFANFESSAVLWIGGLASYLVAALITARLFASKLRVGSRDRQPS